MGGGGAYPADLYALEMNIDCIVDGEGLIWYLRSANNDDLYQLFD